MIPRGKALAGREGGDATLQHAEMGMRGGMRETPGVGNRGAPVSEELNAGRSSAWHRQRAALGASGVAEGQCGGNTQGREAMGESS